MVNVIASIIIQAILLALALVVIVLKSLARVLSKQSVLNLSDAFAWFGWLFTLGWFICSTLALKILLDTPAIGDELVVNSVPYLKIVFVAQYMFDIGIYFPKISITLFYWTLIPRITGPLRNTLLGISVYLGCAMAATILTNTLICLPISDNWSIKNQLRSTWNSYAAFVIQWCLNFSTELLAFFYPFFLLKHIALRKEQKLALVGVFSLGAITLIVSLARFIAYNATDFELEDESGNILTTAEMSTAVLVVCLPGLRRFIGRSKTPTQSSRSNPASNHGIHVQISTNNTSKPRPQQSSYKKWGVRDDEIGLVTHIRAGDSTEMIDMEGQSTDGKSGKTVTLESM
ncbi:Ff.00g038300.m01.CDS01 [Fusarium sp. VM40]|nr:Ff.00g038300.m01.CDS01 [Fusarium sp. VM40]